MNNTREEYNNTRGDYNENIISAFNIFISLLIIFMIVFCSCFIYNIKKEEDRKFKVQPIIHDIQKITVENK